MERLKVVVRIRPDATQHMHACSSSAAAAAVERAGPRCAKLWRDGRAVAGALFDAVLGGPRAEGAEGAEEGEGGAGAEGMGSQGEVYDTVRGHVVRRYSFTLTLPVLKAPMASALETRMSGTAFNVCFQVQLAALQGGVRDGGQERHHLCVWARGKGRAASLYAIPC